MWMQALETCDNPFGHGIQSPPSVTKEATFTNSDGVIRFISVTVIFFLVCIDK